MKSGAPIQQQQQQQQQVLSLLKEFLFCFFYSSNY